MSKWTGSTSSGNADSGRSRCSPEPTPTAVELHPDHAGAATGGGTADLGPVSAPCTSWTYRSVIRVSAMVSAKEVPNNAAGV
jgi:hypothetical protein